MVLDTGSWSFAHAFFLLGDIGFRSHHAVGTLSNALGAVKNTRQEYIYRQAIDTLLTGGGTPTLACSYYSARPVLFVGLHIHGLYIYAGLIRISQA